MKRSKYGAIRTTVDNITFASRKEAKRYGELKLMERAGVIRNLKLQPKFELFAGPTPDHPTVILRKVGTWIGDFEYEEEALKGLWLRKVEDTKGFRTPIYRLKKKLVEAQYPVSILET